MSDKERILKSFEKVLDELGRVVEKAKPKEYALLYIIEFDDDEPDEGQVLHVGTREECDRIIEVCPAVAYGGPRTVKGAHVKVGPNEHEFKNGERFTVRPDPKEEPV